MRMTGGFPLARKRLSARVIMGGQRIGAAPPLEVSTFFDARWISPELQEQKPRATDQLERRAVLVG